MVTNTNNNTRETDAAFNSLQERNSQTLANIQSLQESEQELYQKLDDNTISTEQRTRIVMKINEISQMRLNLYETLKDIYENYGTNVTNAATLSKQQLMAAKIVEKQLNESKVRMNALDLKKNNALRMVEINTYYGKQYNAQARIMKTIAIGCIPIAVASLLANKGIVSEKIYAFIVAIILVVIMLMVGRQYIDMRNRDDMNYDEYDWYFNASTAPSSTAATGATGTGEDEVWASEPEATCTGAACCYEGSRFDEGLNVCVAN
jgi:hypothetical protein